ncbi:CPP1-like family protein [Prochlorococcus sp. MIT 1307]|uniref:CPP1-like family protein n=1 Tax=Prochlorococcus sp. MIT 1307 TaxID=3096219 RepID=UPI002A756C59|nr:CPP1-like family protein [Prochlorococcus sp. MIT 1307]
MASGTNSSSSSGSQDPYSTLGVGPNASFDEVQKARDKRLIEVGEDPLEKARIESSYDALLMVSLKERQLGKVSNAAVNASKREERNIGSGGDGDNSLLTRLKDLNFSTKESDSNGFLPTLALVEGQGLTIRLALGLLATVLILASPKESIQVILSLSTLGLFISQVKRGRRPLPSLGWSVLLLSFGLILGGLLSNVITESSAFAISISSAHLEALPAVILIWVGSLLLD